MRHLLTVLLFLIPVICFTQRINDKLNAGMYDRHKGEIVFSKNILEDGFQKNEKKSEKFNILDDIHARVYLRKPLGYFYDSLGYDYDFELEKYDYNYIVRAFIDGELVAQWYDEMRPASTFEKRLAFSFTIASSKSLYRRGYSDIVNDWVEIIAGLPEGKHNVRLAVLPANIDVIESTNLLVVAEGGFVIDIDKKDKTRFVNTRTTQIPPATFTNEEVEEQIVEAASGVYDGEPLDAVLIDPNEDFTYTRDNNGNILYRNVIAAIMLVNLDDQCEVQSAHFTQEHRGNAQYEDMRFSEDAEGFYEYQIPCYIIQEEESPYAEYEDVWNE